MVKQHLKKTWYIWMSIFLLLSLLLVSPLTADSKGEAASAVGRSTSYGNLPNPVAVTDGITLQQQINWDNTISWNKELARQEAAKRAAEAKAVQREGNVGAAATQGETDITPVLSDGSGLYDSACLYHTMSIGEAHDCWDKLLTYYQVTNPDGTTSLVRRSWSVSVAFQKLYCESRGKSDARNKSGATGLMQVMYGSTDPVENMAEAEAKYQAARKQGGSGWEPWVC